MNHWREKIHPVSSDLIFLFFFFHVAQRYAFYWLLNWSLHFPLKTLYFLKLSTSFQQKGKTKHRKNFSFFNSSNWKNAHTFSLWEWKVFLCSFFLCLSNYLQFHWFYHHMQKILVYFSVYSASVCWSHLILSLYKKLTFPLKISSVNVIKSAVSCGFGHIYWRNL